MACLTPGGFRAMSNLSLSAHRSRIAQKCLSESETACRLHSLDRLGKGKSRDRQKQASFPFLIRKCIS